MSRIFITGSSEGLGLMAGQLLVEWGHQVVLHARNDSRADDTRRALPAAEAVVIGDVSTIAGARRVAEEANELGHFNAVIHNVAIGYREPRRIVTEDGLPHLFAINVLAPYVITSLMKRSERLIYLSSGMHHRVSANFGDLLWEKQPMGRTDGLRGKQTLQCDDGIRGRPALARRSVKLAGARLGAYQNGRAECAR